MATAGVVCCAGGPALIYYVTPTEEELFKRYNPELQKRSLQNRQERQQDFDNFVSKLKEYSKSDKPIWEAAAEAEARERANAAAATARQREEQRARDAEVERLRQEIRSHSRS